MAQMNAATARVIDPVLTAVARGYRSPNAAIADVLFPRVAVAQRGGRILVFGPEDFALANTKRAPGSNTKRVEFGYSSTPYALVDYSLEGSVPIELQQEAEAVPGLDLGAGAIRRVKNIMENEREKEAADLALTAGNYPSGNKVTLSGTAQWSDPTNSNPFTDIQAAREAIRASVGYYPNVMELGPKVYTALSTHPKILDRLSTASDRPPATITQLQALFEIPQIIVGTSVYYSGSAFVDMWGKHAVLAYTTPASAQDMGSPSFGYTYQLDGYPLAEEPYYERNPKTWYYPNTDARQVVLVGATAGYLVTNAVA